MSRETYRIVRYYKEMGKKPKVMREGVTLEEAKRHCNDKSTQKKGVYFDGFEKE